MKFGVVGTGYWATETHGTGIKNHPDAELVGLWGRDPAKRDAAAASLGVNAYAHYEDLLDAVDAVAFAVPPNVQCELATIAARAGKHLLLDKPLAFTAAEAMELVAACEASGVASVVFFTARFTPATRRWIAEARTHSWWAGRSIHLGRIIDADSPFNTPWRHDRGGLWDVGPHALANLIPVLGPVTDVKAVGGPADLAQLVVTHDSGAASTLTLSVLAPASALRHVVEVWGEPGISSPAQEDFSALDSYAVALGELMESARTGKAHECDVHFGAEVVEVLEAAHNQIRG